MTRDTPEQRLTPPSHDIVIGICDACEEPIYEGDDIEEDDCFIYHKECVEGDDDADS